MGKDNKTVLKNSKEKESGWFELEIKQEDLECNRMAEESCPVNVIHVVK